MHICVNELDKEEQSFAQFQKIYSYISKAKLKIRLDMLPLIRELMNDTHFDSCIIAIELKA